MKRIKQTVLLFCVMLAAAAVKAQNTGLPPVAKLWLYNSEGKTLTSQDAIVNRNYFTAEWIDIQCEKPLVKGTRYMVIIQPPQSSAYAETLVAQRLSQRVVSAINKAESGTKITIVKEDPKTKGVTKDGGTIQFTLN